MYVMTMSIEWKIKYNSHERTVNEKNDSDRYLPVHMILIIENYQMTGTKKTGLALIMSGSVMSYLQRDENEETTIGLSVNSLGLFNKQ